MKIVIGIVVVVIAVLGFVVLSPDKKQNNPPGNNAAATSSTETSKVDTQSELLIGKSDAKATIIEYGDFKCPSCNRFHQTSAKQLRTEYIEPGKLKLVFRPLAVIGPDSERSAVGAYCANDQSKFVQYHDAVYDFMWNNYYKSGDFSAEYKDILNAAKLKELATSAGLDSVAFEVCLIKAEATKTVEGNLTKAEADGARGTPTFRIGNQTIVGPQPFSVFQKLVDIQLQ